MPDQPKRPAVVFVTAHANYAVEAFDLDAVDYVLKPVQRERLGRAIKRALSRQGEERETQSEWLKEIWIPHRSELIRIETAEVGRIDAERDYVRLHVGERSYLLLQTIAGLEEKLDPEQFIRIHRSTILRKDRITGLRHDGLGRLVGRAGKRRRHADRTDLSAQGEGHGRKVEVLVLHTRIG